jgi:hypothetical protein
LYCEGLFYDEAGTHTLFSPKTWAVHASFVWQQKNK